MVLCVTTGAFPGSEVDTGGEIVQLTEPANVLGILFAFLYPKAHPDLQGESFNMVTAVAEAAGKYDAFSAVHVCNERLLTFLPQHAPEILVHAVKHDSPRLINATLPHLARAPFLSVLEKLPPYYMVPWARYCEAWKSLFKDLVQHIKKLPRCSNNECHSSMSTHRPTASICGTCIASLHVLIIHLEEIDALSTLRETLQSPNTEYLKSALSCCQPNSSSGSSWGSVQQNSPCPFINDVTKLCQNKINQMPLFTTFLDIKVYLVPTPFQVT